MRSMWSVEIVEALPDGQLLLEIDIVFVGEELVELVFVCSVGPLNLPVELRRSCLDVDGSMPRSATCQWNRA